MTEETSRSFGLDQAQALLDAGWGQCVVFHTNGDFPHNDVDGLFVVCTQSCTVVSPSLDRDPFVEIAIGRRLAKFHPRSPQARGKDVRKLHIPVEGADFEGLEVDINSRRFVKRELLLAATQTGYIVTDRDRQNFAGWIARYYSRIALPNELVDRLKLTIFKQLTQFLEAQHGKAGCARHDEIGSMWIKFNPDLELPKDEKYQVKLLIICDHPDVAEAYDRELIAIYGERPVVIDGIEFSFDVNTPDETRLSDLNGWHRFTEWDHLSEMGAMATVADRA